MSEMVCYSINQSKVVFDRFDDEVVLINLENGNYFSIRAVASVVWDMLVSGMDEQSVVSSVSKMFSMDATEVAADVRAFIAQLLSDDLLMSCHSGNGPEPLAMQLSEASGSYSKPVLEVYSDMQDLILLDPIHEVNEAGWPNLK